MPSAELLELHPLDDQQPISRDDDPMHDGPGIVGGREVVMGQPVRSKQREGERAGEGEKESGERGGEGREGGEREGRGGGERERGGRGDRGR